MAAQDTFEWFVSNISKNPDPKLLEYIKQQRVYFLSLRSEDEKGRFVESLINEMAVALNR